MENKIPDKEFGQIMEICQSVIRANKSLSDRLLATNELISMQQQQIIELKQRLEFITDRVRALEIVSEFEDNQSNSGNT